MANEAYIYQESIDPEFAHKFNLFDKEFSCIKGHENDISKRCSV